MKTVHTQTMYLCFSETYNAPRIYEMDMTGANGYTLLKEFEVTTEVPNIDITGERIKGLEKKKAELVEEHRKAIELLNGRIQELKALTHDVGE